MFAETPVVVFKWVVQRQDINIMFEEQLKALLDKVQLPAPPFWNVYNISSALIGVGSFILSSALSIKGAAPSTQKGLCTVSYASLGIFTISTGFCVAGNLQYQRLAEQIDQLDLTFPQLCHWYIHNSFEGQLPDDIKNQLSSDTQQYLNIPRLNLARSVQQFCTAPENAATPDQIKLIQLMISEYKNHQKQCRQYLGYR